jgi:hypothetical protein
MVWVKSTGMRPSGIDVRDKRHYWRWGTALACGAERQRGSNFHSSVRSWSLVLKVTVAFRDFLICIRNCSVFHCNCMCLYWEISFIAHNVYTLCVKQQPVWALGCLVLRILDHTHTHHTHLNARTHTHTHTHTQTLRRTHTRQDASERVISSSQGPYLHNRQLLRY